LTVAWSRVLASSTNAGVTPAPPLDTSRRLATRCARNPGVSMREMKNVGGPIMKVIAAVSMISSAASGSQRAMRLTRIGTTPGSSTALSSPEMWARGAGIKIASAGVSWWAPAMTRAL